jgi:hypothetical protein
MAKTKHELEVASNQAVGELAPDSKFMGGLKSMVWGNNAPFSKTVPKDEALNMYAAELATPQGRTNLIARFGQQEAARIEQELVKTGHVDSAMITDPQENANG